MILLRADKERYRKTIKRRSWLVHVTTGQFLLYYHSRVLRLGGCRSILKRELSRQEGVAIFGQNVSATALWGLWLEALPCLFFSSRQLLGAIRGFISAANRRDFLSRFAYSGSLFATLLLSLQSWDVWLAVTL